MNESLPLFQFDAPRVARPALGRDPHLEAARRLARRMRRLPDHSAEQVQAGQQICRHLVAMLRAHETASTGGPADASH